MVGVGDRVTSALELFGAVSVVAGVALWSVAAALIVAGLAMMAAGYGLGNGES